MKNHLKTVLMLSLLSALLVGIGSSLGGIAPYAALALAVLLNVGAYFFSDRLVLKMHGAREVGRDQEPGLHQVVEQLSQAAGLPKPRVFVMEEPQPNAFATGRNPSKGVVAVTRGLMELLDERELRGVIAHELAHIKNRDILLSTIAATVAAAVTYLAHAAGWLSAFGGGQQEDEEGPSVLQTLALALVAPVAATLIQLGISRSREYLADKTGAELSGDPEALARALAKLQRGAEQEPNTGQPATASLFIVSPFAGTERILSLFSTHPRTEERIRRLHAMSSSVRALEERWPRAMGLMD